MYILGVYSSQQVEERQHREGRGNGWMHMLVCIQAHQLSAQQKEPSFAERCEWQKVSGWSPVATKAQKFKGVNVTLSSTAIKQTNAAKGLP